MPVTAFMATSAQNSRFIRPKFYQGDVSLDLPLRSLYALEPSAFVVLLQAQPESLASTTFGVFLWKSVVCAE